MGITNRCGSCYKNEGEAIRLKQENAELKAENEAILKEKLKGTVTTIYHDGIVAEAMTRVAAMKNEKAYWKREAEAQAGNTLKAMAISGKEIAELNTAYEVQEKAYDELQCEVNDWMHTVHELKNDLQLTREMGLRLQHERNDIAGQLSIRSSQLDLVEARLNQYIEREEKARRAKANELRVRAYPNRDDRTAKEVYNELMAGDTIDDDETNEWLRETDNENI